jgi:hypothetical protein
MKALLAIAAVALGGALATPGAQAEELPGKDQSIYVKGGYAEFHHYGEILEVSDGILNGRGVRAYLSGVGDSKVGNHQVSDYQANGRPVRLNLSLPERQKVVLRVCYTIDHKRDQCSDWQLAFT